LDDDGIKAISSGIKTNNSITTLNLSGNHFGELGAKYLSDALEANKSIQYIDLSRNALGFNAINSVLCACKSRSLMVLTNGNYVFEEILNSVSHGLAFLFSVVGAFILMSEALDGGRTDYHFWACLLYSFALLFLFLSSCLYHSFFMSPASKSSFSAVLGCKLCSFSNVGESLTITIAFHFQLRVSCRCWITWASTW
jgi:hypothetical protein